MLKNDLALKFNAPLNELNPNKGTYILINQINKIANAIKKGALAIPDDKLKEMKLNLVNMVFDNFEAVGKQIPENILAVDKNDLPKSDDFINFC